MNYLTTIREKLNNLRKSNNNDNSGLLNKLFLDQYPQNSRFAESYRILRTQERAVAKFDESIEIAMNLGVDPRHADQQVRGTMTLPHGTGREVRVLAFAEGDAARAAADYLEANPSRHLVILAGSGHVVPPEAIPGRLARMARRSPPAVPSR